MLFFFWFCLVDVEVSVDMRRARVFYRSGEKENTKGDAREAKFLTDKNGLIRYHLTQRIRMKYSPSLEFVKDDSVEQTQSLERMLDKIQLEMSNFKD